MGQPPDSRERRPLVETAPENGTGESSSSTSTIRHLTAAPVMTKAERVELAKLARLRARVARSEVDQRAAELRVDVEAKLSATFTFGDEAWADVTREAETAVAEADRHVAERCEQLGIPAEFRPTLSLRWYGRGENAVASRRAELRTRAVAQIDARSKAAKHTIEAASVEVQTQLLAGGLTTQAAREFLAAMPTPAELMPALEVAELKALGGAS